MDGLIAYALSKKYVDGKTSSIATGVSWKGTKENISSLPQSGNSVGDLWHVNEDGNEYAWDGSKWEALGGSSVEEKALKNRGFAYCTVGGSSSDPGNLLTLNALQFRTSLPENGSIVCFMANRNLTANATVRFRITGNASSTVQYTQEWPIKFSATTLKDGQINKNDFVAMMLQGNSYYVISIYPLEQSTGKTKLSDFENDLSLSNFENDLNFPGIHVLDLSSSALSFNQLLYTVKSGISGSSGEKTMVFQAPGRFNFAVGAVANYFYDDKQLPVINLGTGNFLPVLEVGADDVGTDDEYAWFTVLKHETETTESAVIGYKHEITVSTIGVVIYTKKYEIEVQTLPSGD